MPEPRGNGRLDRPGFFRYLALSPSGDRLYLITNDKVQAWNLDKAAKPVPVWPDTRTAPTVLAVSPDGFTLAVGERSGSVTLIDTRDGTIRQKLEPVAGDASEGSTNALAFSPNGLQLAAGTQLGQINLWNLEGKTPEFLARFPAHRGQIMSISYDPQGTHLATCGSDHIVDIWNIDKIKDELGQLGLAW